jgi:hypothetical protein
MLRTCGSSSISCQVCERDFVCDDAVTEFRIVCTEQLTANRALTEALKVQATDIKVRNTSPNAIKFSSVNSTSVGSSRAQWSWISFAKV